MPAHFIEDGAVVAVLPDIARLHFHGISPTVDFFDGKGISGLYTAGVAGWGVEGAKIWHL